MNLQDRILLHIRLNSVNNNKNRLTGFDNTLNILNPENVLRRGYTITSFNGKILKSSDQLKMDDIIDTRFTDGTVSSKVVDRIIQGEDNTDIRIIELITI